MLELNFRGFLHRGALRCFNLVHGFLVETEHASNEVVGEGLYGIVQFASGRIEVAANGSELVLDVGEFTLQLEEVLVRFKSG